MTKKGKLYYWGIAGVLLFLVFLFYGVGIDIPFAHHDSLRYFGKYFQISTADPAQDPYYQYSWTIGRPVCAELENLIFQNADGFAGLSKARMACTALLALLAGLFTICCRQFGFSNPLAILSGLWLVVLPGVQHNVYMLAPHYTLAAGCAVGAYLVWTSGRAMPFRLALTAGMLWGALLSYAAAAFLFLSLLAVRLLWIEEREWGRYLREILLGAGVLVFCSVLYLEFNQLVLAPRFPLAAVNAYPAYQLRPSFGTMVSKLAHLFNEGAVFVLNPFSPQGGRWAGYVVVGFILGGMVLNRDWPRSSRGGRIIVWCGLLIASVLVWALSQMDLFLYRVFYPGMVLCALSLLWAVAISLERLGASRSFSAIFLAGFLLLSIAAAHRTLTLNVWNANAEMTFVRSQLARAAGIAVRRVHVVEPIYTAHGFNGQRVMDDDLNMNSSSFDFDLSNLVKMGLWGQIPERPLRHCWGEQKECVERAPEGILLLTHSKPGEPLFVSADMVVIDFNDMVRATQVFRDKAR